MTYTTSSDCWIKELHMIDECVTKALISNCEDKRMWDVHYYSIVPVIDCIVPVPPVIPPPPTIVEDPPTVDDAEPRPERPQPEIPTPDQPQPGVAVPPILPGKPIERTGVNGTIRIWVGETPPAIAAGPNGINPDDVPEDVVVYMDPLTWAMLTAYSPELLKYGATRDNLGGLGYKPYVYQDGFLDPYTIDLLMNMGKVVRDRGSYPFYDPGTTSEYEPPDDPPSQRPPYVDYPVVPPNGGSIIL